MKEDIKIQLITQIRFWKEFQTHEPNFDILVSLSREIYDKSSKTTQQYLKNRPAFIGSHFLEAILTSGLYFSFAQNNLSSGEKLIQEYYNLKLRNSQDAALKIKHSKANISLQSMYFIVSGSHNEAGKILDCSHNTTKVLGTKRI